MGVARFLIVSVVVALSLPSVAASTGPEAILLEVRVGPTAVEQQGAVGGFLDGWGGRILSGADLEHAIEERMSTPAGDTGGLLARLASALAEIRQRRYAVRGNWHPIIELLRPLHDDLQHNVRSLAIDRETRGATVKALMLLAVAYEGIHDNEQATNILNQVVRDFPDQKVSVETARGPESYRLYEAAAAAAARKRRVKLLVEAQPGGCSVFVNEVRVGSSPRAEASVVPGRYRVFVDCGSGRHSRVWPVSVSESASIRVDVPSDNALDASGDRVALVFHSERERALNEIAFASQIGHALGVRRVVTLGLDANAHNGGPALIARLIDPDQGQIASHSIAVPTGTPPPLTITRELGTRLREKQTAVMAAGGGEQHRAKGHYYGVDGTLTIEQMLALSEQYFKQAKYKAASRYAYPAARELASAKAWEIIATAQCYLSSGPIATNAMAHLSAPVRHHIQVLCGRMGTVVPTVDEAAASPERLLEHARFLYRWENYYEAALVAGKAIARAGSDKKALALLVASECMDASPDGLTPAASKKQALKMSANLNEAADRADAEAICQRNNIAISRASSPMHGLVEGWADFRKKHYAAAAERARAVLTASKGNLGALLLLGSSSCALDDTRTARSAYSQVSGDSLVRWAIESDCIQNNLWIRDDR